MKCLRVWGGSGRRRFVSRSGRATPCEPERAATPCEPEREATPCEYRPGPRISLHEPKAHPHDLHHPQREALAGSGPRARVRAGGAGHCGFGGVREQARDGQYSLTKPYTRLHSLKRSTVLTASHSFRSSPGGKVTAERRLPVPRVRCASVFSLGARRGARRGQRGWLGRRGQDGHGVGTCGAPCQP